MPLPATKPAKSRTLGKDLVGQLLLAILRGEIAGGQWLVEQNLAERFGVSRTPIREAINQLTSFGVVAMYPNRGAQVQPFGPQQLREVYEVRRILETEAARAAAGRVPEGELRIIRQRSAALLDFSERSAGWARRQTQLDRRLHELIATHCGNARLAQEIDRYAAMIRAVRESLGHRYEVREQAVREHLKIIDALLRGDADGAAAAMDRHITATASAAVLLFTDMQRN